MLKSKMIIALSALPIALLSFGCQTTHEQRDPYTIQDSDRAHHAPEQQQHQQQPRQPEPEAGQPRY